MFDDEEWGLYCDRRLGREHWYIGRAQDADMRVSTTVRECVVFLCGKNADEDYKIGGTAFLVTLAGEGAVHPYFVTAGHSIREVREKYEELYLRINMKDAWYTKAGRSVDYIKVPFDWTCSDDPAVDVAVLPAPLALTLGHQLAVIPEEMFLTDAISKEYHLSVGDEVLITGLFSKRAGRERNIPIVRGGMVAAGPEEPLRDVGRTGLSYRAYLLEVRSIGGISGSPVFVFFGYDRDKDGRINQHFKVFLLGMIRGHWNYQPDESEDAVGDERKGGEPLNSGIAIAVPVQEVVAVLNKEELVKQRRERERKIAEKDEPTLDWDDDESRPGREPERLKIDEPMDSAVKKMFEKGKPPKE